MTERDSFVQILLASYNGEEYLAEQIDSIMNQSYCDFELIVRDDGSSDSTKYIVSESIKRYPNKIRVLEDALGNLGASRCFFQLLEYSSSDYIMFCMS